MVFLEQFWSSIVHEPRYITYAGLILGALGIGLVTFASITKGPVGSRFSGKRAADGSGRQGPRPGLEARSVIIRRRMLAISGILLILAGVGLQIAADEIQVAPN